MFVRVSLKLNLHTFFSAYIESNLYDCHKDKGIVRSESLHQNAEKKISGVFKRTAGDADDDAIRLGIIFQLMFCLHNVLVGIDNILVFCHNILQHRKFHYFNKLLYCFSVSRTWMLKLGLDNYTARHAAQTYCNAKDKFLSKGVSFTLV